MKRLNPEIDGDRSSIILAPPLLIPNQSNRRLNLIDDSLDGHRLNPNWSWKPKLVLERTIN
jgi:hypothetical protein